VNYYFFAQTAGFALDVDVLAKLFLILMARNPWESIH
jgi:hypothetical protein